MHYKLFKKDNKEKFGKAYMWFTANAFRGIKVRPSYEDKVTLFSSNDIIKEQILWQYIKENKINGLCKHVIGVDHLDIGKNHYWQLLYK